MFIHIVFIILVLTIMVCGILKFDHNQRKYSVTINYTTLLFVLSL